MNKNLQNIEKTYSNKSNAKRAAKRLGYTNVEIIAVDDKFMFSPVKKQPSLLSALTFDTEEKKPIIKSVMGIKHPTEKSKTCKQLWEFFDTLENTYSLKVVRNKAKQHNPNWNENTINTQFYRWRTFNSK